MVSNCGAAARRSLGTYLGSCTGCHLSEQKVSLTCTQCVNTRARRVESTISLTACNEDEVIGNHDGQLTCEMRPNHGIDGPFVDENENGKKRFRAGEL